MSGDVQGTFFLMKTFYTLIIKVLYAILKSREVEN